MTSQHPRDMREWMRQIERNQRTNATALPGMVRDGLDTVREEQAAKDSRTPTAPIELTYQTALFTDIQGRRQARLILDFPDVTKATDGTGITVAQYELWGKDISLSALEVSTSAVTGLAAPGLTIPGLAATVQNIAAATGQVKGEARIDTSASSAFRTAGFNPGSIWEFRVRAIGTTTTIPGVFSEPVQVLMEGDTVPPPQPTAPKVTVTRGTITVTWDGQAVSGSMPGDFRYLAVAHGTASSPVTEVDRFYRGGGFTVVSDVPYYSPQFFRFQAVDESGNRGPWSEQSVAYTTPLVDTDVILSTIDAAKTHLKNIDAGVSILDNTIITEHLVITEDMTAALAQFLKVRAGMIEANAVEADHIKAGAVRASKLEADLALLTRIIAGDPLGPHAEMTPDGFHVYSITKEGASFEAVRMGTAEDDFFAIISAAGEVVAAVDRNGNVNAQDVNIADTLTVRGRTLDDILYPAPKGIYGHGWGAQYSNPASTQGQMGVFEITVDLKSDRMYRIQTSPIRIYSNGPNSSHLRVRWTSSTTGTPATPGVGSPIMAQAEHEFHSEGYQTLTINKITRMDTGRYRLLLCYSSDAGGTASTQMIGSNEYPIEMWVEDIGPYTANLQVPNKGDGQAVVAAAQIRQTLTRPATAIMSYATNNSQYRNDYMYQGPSPAGYGNNLHSLALFADMTSELSGATIERIQVGFEFPHWYENDGGTAFIGVHGHMTIPTTFAAPGAQVSSPGWPKPGMRWVDLPSGIFNNFKTGASRGVSLEGNGTVDSYGYAKAPTIVITYLK